MCITATTALLITTAASAAVGVYGTFMQAQAAQAQAEYNAAVMRNQALDAKYRAQTEEEKHREKIQQAVGAARARVAANGLLVGDPGSTSDALIEDLIVAGELDILRIRDNANRTASGFEQKATLLDFQADSINPLFEAGAAAVQGAAAYASVNAKYGSSSLAPSGGS